MYRLLARRMLYVRDFRLGVSKKYVADLRINCPQSLLTVMCWPYIAASNCAAFVDSALLLFAHIRVAPGCTE